MDIRITPKLMGEAQFGKDLLRAGDYLYTAPNRKHAVYSERGCVVFVIVPQEVEVLRRS
jgi:quercetin dioxygenase-like cupin family protein